ncbi:MAG: hypothetical protein ACKOYK_07635 [Cyanobium sp.]
MNDPLPFVLEPFGQSADALGLQLEGDLTRQGDRLRLTYQLTGNLASVVRPPRPRQGPSGAMGSGNTPASSSSSLPRAPSPIGR